MQMPIMQPATSTEIFQDFQTKTELQRTFGRGETYIYEILKSLEKYNQNNPQTYIKDTVYETLPEGSRLYYNVYVVNHYMRNRSKLELGVDIPYDYKEEDRRIRGRIRTQRELLVNRRIVEGED